MRSFLKFPILVLTVAIALAIGAPIAAIAQTIAPTSNTFIDLSPLFNQAIQIIGIFASLAAAPMLWWGVQIVQNKFHLSGLQVDASMRATIDQGLQKAIGAGVALAQNKFAGATVRPIDVKNEVVASAINYAIKHIPDALAHFGLNDEDKIKAMIESRLGMAAVAATQASGDAAPVSTAANATASPAAPSA